jgi:hypothetical protein
VLTISQVAGKGQSIFVPSEPPAANMKNKESNGSTNRLKESRQKGRQNQNL